jgi:hypothetical protein
MQECSPKFDEQVFKTIMCADQIPNTPHSVFYPGVLAVDDAESDASGDQALTPLYSHASLIFNLPQIGVMVSRRRLYARYHRNRSVNVTPEDIGVRFEDIYYAQARCTANVYMVADEAVIAMERSCRLLSVDADMTAGASSTELQCLSTGDFNRLEGWAIQAMKSGLCERTADGATEWHVRVALAVISQTDNYWGKIQTVGAPAVLPRHVIFDLVRQRAVTAMEEWILQGYQHPDAEALTELAEHFPIPQLFAQGRDRLQLADQKKLIGNGMHLATVGAWTMHQLSMTTFAPE